MEHFEDIQLLQEYDPYFCSVKEAIALVIIGTFCGFKNLKQIHQWASHEKISNLLQETFGIKRIPCYFWLTRLLKIIDSDSMNQCFVHWVSSLLPENMEGQTISFDGKTIRSTNKMECFEQPLQIVSAQIAELGLTFAQETVYDKSNEIPTVQNLIKTLKLKGCIVVADALNCQKETATAIVEQRADYILSVKDNHKNLRKNIEDFVQDKELRKTMDQAIASEKNRDRFEKRVAYVCSEINWLEEKGEWESLKSIGAIQTKFTSKNKTTEEWHYFIISKQISASDLLKHVRNEWSVETMHWLLDVHFQEDFCRMQEANIQKVLNMIRKIVLNSMRSYKDKTKSKRPISNIMLDCLIDPCLILEVCKSEN